MNEAELALSRPQVLREMRMSFRGSSPGDARMKKHLLLAALAALSLSSLSASAQTVTTVTFTGPSNTGLSSGLLSGVLYRPADYSSRTNIRAVVMMHGCGGMWSNRVVGATNSNGTPNLQNHIEKWGLKLASEGYVALAVDSYTRRRPSGADSAAWQNQCNETGNPYAGAVDPYTTRVLDARAAFTYLASDSRIDSTRIGLLGWSQGGQSVMVESAETYRDSNTVRSGSDATRFRISVVFYPGCGSALGFGSPTSSYWRPDHDLRMNLGGADALTPNCEARADTAISTYGATSGSGRQVLRITYTGAAHGFDGESQTWPSSSTCPDETPDTQEEADLCAMIKADINSWIFFRDRM
jgi:dienelactone hydrolase